MPSLPTIPGGPERPRSPRFSDPPRLAPPPDLRRGVAVHARRALGRRRLLGLLGAGPGTPLGTRPRPVQRRDAVRTLVHRITQGFQLPEYERAKALGYDAYLEEQLHPESIDDSETDGRLQAFPTLNQSPGEILTNYAEDPGIPLLELKGAAVVRAVHSRRQLLERMVEFWTDHFNIDHNKEVEFALKPEDDRLVIRQHALGTFPDLLRASAHSGAMLFYLDNWLNFAGTPQENYARELMELHTLGVDGGYTEDDVKEVAKCLTGWTLELDANSPDYLRSRFEFFAHTPGPKHVLGTTIPGFPPREQLNAVVDLLAMHPATAHHVASKLTRWFLREDPPAEVVDSVAATYLSTGGDIRAMLRVILARENLKWSSTVWAPRFRRPFHFVTSLLRGLQLEVSDPLYLVYYLMTMGHSPFDWHPPNGYPDTVAAWGANLLPRWAFASALTERAVPGVRNTLAVPALLEGPGELVRRIDERLLGKVLSDREVALLQEYADGLEPLTGTDVLEVVGLAASAPGFQWY